MVTCAHCHLPIRQGMSVPLPGRDPVTLCLTCLRDALAAMLQYMADLTEQQALELLAGIPDGYPIEQALEAAGIPDA